MDDDMILRETAFYLETGANTSSHALLATLHCIFLSGLVSIPETGSSFAPTDSSTAVCSMKRFVSDQTT